MGMCVPPAPVLSLLERTGAGGFLVWQPGLYRGSSCLPLHGYSPRILRRTHPRRVAFSSASMRESSARAWARSRWSRRW